MSKKDKSYLDTPKFLPPNKAPAGINEAIKLHWFSVTKNSVFVEFVKIGIAGPDQPMHVPKIRPPIVAVNAA